MDLGILNETVILIDTDFLNERLNWNLKTYQELYPNRKFEKINLLDLIYNFLLNARFEEAGHNVDILFAYTLGNNALTNCEPNDVFDFIDHNQIKMETDKGTFSIRSFFGDEYETCGEHYLNMLRMVNYSPQVSRIIMVADSYELNNELEIMNKQNDKSLFLLKKYHGSEIAGPIKYVNINYPIAYALGLNDSEI